MILFRETFDSTGLWHNKCRVCDELGETDRDVENIRVPASFDYLAFWHSKQVPHDQENKDGWAQPEGRFESIAQFPDRVAEGFAAWMMFGMWHIVDAALVKTLTVPKDGILRISFQGHAWSSNNDIATTSEGVGAEAFNVPYGTGWLTSAQRNIFFDVGIGNPFIAGLNAARHIYNRYAKVSAEFAVTAGEVPIYIRGQSLWRFKHNNFYFDDLTVEFEPTDIPTGYPRTQYVRKANVIPETASRDRATEIFQICWDRGRQSVTRYDDAGIGALEDKTAILWDIPEAEHETFVKFFEDYYPGTVVEFDGISGGGDPTGEPTPYELRSDNLVGLHSGFVRAESWNYIRDSGTNIQKFFSAGDAYKAGLMAPMMKSVWRKYVGNEEGRIDEKPTIRESAIWYLDQYTAEINVAAKALGISVEQLLRGITALESLNETIPTRNPAQLERAVEFDVCFSDEAKKRYGDLVSTVLLCGAIGNPDVDEVHYLLPAAQAAVRNNGFLGYHCYWTANESHDFLDDHWLYHAGRWTEWDRVFVANGLYPRYCLGEGGIVYAADGVTFNSGLGWKACGSIEKYIASIDKFNKMALEWNREHANRFCGFTIFGYGNWGWDKFELGDGDVVLLSNWATGSVTRMFNFFAKLERTAVREEALYTDALVKYLASTNYLPSETSTILASILKGLVLKNA